MKRKRNVSGFLDKRKPMGWDLWRRIVATAEPSQKLTDQSEVMRYWNSTVHKLDLLAV